MLKVPSMEIMMVVGTVTSSETSGQIVGTRGERPRFSHKLCEILLRSMVGIMNKTNVVTFVKNICAQFLILQIQDIV